MSLLKPTIQMPFHIDFAWWEQNDSDWHVFLRSLLCPEHQQSLADVQEGALIDWVDPKTAEVKQVDGIQHALMTHCALQPDFVDPHTALVEAVFRALSGKRKSTDERDLGIVEETSIVRRRPFCVRPEPGAAERFYAEASGQCNCMPNPRRLSGSDVPADEVLKAAHCPCSSTDRATAF